MNRTRTDLAIFSSLYPAGFFSSSLSSSDRNLFPSSREEMVLPRSVLCIERFFFRSYYTTKYRDEGQDKDSVKTKQIPTDKIFPLDRGCCFAAADAVITHLMRQEKCVTLRLRIDCVRDLYPLLMPEKGNEVCLLYSSSCTYAFKSVLFAVYPPPFPRHAFIICTHLRMN